MTVESSRSATSSLAVAMPARDMQVGCRVSYQLRHLDTGTLVRTYDKEGAALAFMRDVIRLGGRDAASRFALTYEDEHGNAHAIAEGEALMRRALEDRAEA